MGRIAGRGRLGAGLALLGVAFLLPRIVFASPVAAAAESVRPRKAFAVVIGNNHSLRVTGPISTTRTTMPSDTFRS
jgi:hypothetical protein